MHENTPEAGIQIIAVVVNKAWEEAVLLPQRKPGASDVRKGKGMSLCAKNCRLVWKLTWPLS